jgi:hypothetical protein
MVESCVPGAGASGLPHNPHNHRPLRFRLFGTRFIRAIATR